MNKSIIEENLLDIIQQHQNSQNMLNSSNSNVNGSSCSTDDFSSDTCSLLEEECNLNDNLSLEELILKKERLRQQTVLELVKTETSYVRDLKLIVKLFIEPVRSKISIRDYHDVFGNTERLLNLHREVLAVLEGLPLKPPNQQNIGEVLCNFFNNDEYNNLYQSCCSHQIHCNESFEKLKSTSKVFANCVDEASKNYLIRGLSYQMLIIKPIQRITKYPLLIKSLLENTSSEFSDYKYLQASMQKINDVLEDVNYKKKLADEKNDNDKKLKEIESSLEDTNITNNSNRRFIKEGLASKKIDKELLRLILCSDVMILAKNKTSKATVKQIFQLKNILVRDGIESLPGFTQGFELIVIEKKEKIFSLFFQSESEKKEWFQQIYSMTNQVNESQTLLKYKWFLKKSSSFIGSNGVSSASSTPPFSIDISSLSPSTSKESSPKSESPSYSHTVGTSHGRLVSNPNNTSGVFKQPTSTSNGVVPNGSVNSSGGSLRDRKPPPPPPRVQDIFKKSNESTPINCRSSSPSPPPTSPFILDSQYSPPIFSTANGGLSSKSPNSTLHIKNPSPNNTLNLKSTNPSPNSTLNFKNTNPSPNGTLNLKNPSPTNTLKLSTSGNGSSSPIVINSSSFSRASSLPSFNQTDEDVKPPTPKKMPSTISSIPQSFTDQNSGIHTTTSTPSTPTTVSASKPMLPPRNYVQDDQSENKQQQQQHFEPISKLTKSNSNNKLLPPPLLPPPPLVPPPPIMNPVSPRSTAISSEYLPPPPPPLSSAISPSTSSINLQLSQTIPPPLSIPSNSSTTTTTTNTCTAKDHSSITFVNGVIHPNSSPIPMNPLKKSMSNENLNTFFPPLPPPPPPLIVKKLPGRSVSPNPQTQSNGSLPKPPSPLTIQPLLPSTVLANTSNNSIGQKPPSPLTVQKSLPSFQRPVEKSQVPLTSSNMITPTSNNTNTTTPSSIVGPKKVVIVRPINTTTPSTHTDSKPLTNGFKPISPTTPNTTNSVVTNSTTLLNKKPAPPPASTKPQSPVPMSMKQVALPKN